MKIEAKNAYSFINHIKLLAYLSGQEEPEELKTYAYSCEGEGIYSKLLRIEAKAHRLQVMQCNGDITEDDASKKEERIIKQVRELLPKLAEFETSLGKKLFFLNGDPRGYTLKCKEDILNPLDGIMGIRGYTDWGNYFILAPEF